MKLPKFDAYDKEAIFVLSLVGLAWVAVCAILFLNL